MIKEIEETIAKHFHSHWGSKEILFWIKEAKYEVDCQAIDKNLNNPITNFIMRGGKRWRPVLFLTTLRLLGMDWKKHLDVAFALELAHNATLIIDDIEDSAELRRGKPACHKIFGTDIAVNAGVLAHFLPLKILLNKKGITEKQDLELLKIYIEEIINVYFGQTLDIAWHHKPHQITIEQYLEMTRLKTGALIRMAERIACYLAGKEELEKDIVGFAELAGIAFQIKDDCLEFTAKEKVFGKSFGNDITEGKMSLPVIMAMEKLDSISKKRLLEILSMHTRSKKIIKEFMAIISKAGAVDDSLKYADDLIEKAWAKIEHRLPAEKKRCLEDFKNVTYSLVKRNK